MSPIESSELSQEESLGTEPMRKGAEELKFKIEQGFKHLTRRARDLLFGPDLSPEQKKGEGRIELLRANKNQKTLNEQLPKLAKSELPLEEIILKIHQLSTEDCNIPQGYRKKEVYTRSYFPPFQDQIPMLMKRFINKVETMLQKLRSGEEAEALAVWSTAIFLRIHPFSNGNKRTALNLAKYFLLKSEQGDLDLGPHEAKSLYEQPLTLALSELSFLFREGAERETEDSNLLEIRKMKKQAASTCQRTIEQASLETILADESYDFSVAQRVIRTLSAPFPKNG